MKKSFLLMVFRLIVKTCCIPEFNSLLLKANVLDNCCLKQINSLLTTAKHWFCEKISFFKSNIHELTQTYSF